MIPQQPHQIRCATCKNACYWRGRINTGFTHDMGCPRHTYAVDYEQRVKDVIAELTKLRETAIGEISNRDIAHDAYRDGKILVCNNAIALLKEGVK